MEDDAIVGEAGFSRRLVVVDVQSEAVPRVTALRQNYPPPFNPTTTLRYQVATPGMVTLRIYNVRGQLVKTLVSRAQKPGYYGAVWKGDANNGNAVASGVYFYEMRAPGFRKAKKMVLLR